MKVNSKLTNLVLCFITLIFLCYLSAIINHGIDIPQLIVILLLCGSSYICCTHNPPVLYEIPDTERDYRYDWLRLFAVLSVITLHSIDTVIPELRNDGASEFLIRTLSTVKACLLCSNLIYVMISGALLLGGKEESIADFYKKRGLKVLLPAVIYYIFYIWQQGALTPYSFEKAGNILHLIFSCDCTYCPPYWLIYTILGLYIFMPFVKIMIKNLSYNALTVFVIIMFILSSLYCCTDFGLDSQIGLWLGVAVMGYWISREQTRKYLNIIKLLGILGTILTIATILIFKEESIYLDKLTYCTPFMESMAAGIFALFFSTEKKSAKANIPLLVFNKYNFTIIILHWWSLYFIHGQIGGRKTIFSYIYLGVKKYIGAVPGLISVIIMATMLSIVTAFLLDNYFYKAIRGETK